MCYISLKSHLLLNPLHNLLVWNKALQHNERGEIREGKVNGYCYHYRTRSHWLCRFSHTTQNRVRRTCSVCVCLFFFLKKACLLNLQAAPLAAERCNPIPSRRPPAIKRLRDVPLAHQGVESLQNRYHRERSEEISLL